HRFPVPRPGGTIHPHVAGRVDVAEPGDRSVPAGEVGSVDDDLVPGQEHERGTGGRVLGDEAAEGDVVPGGVFDPGDDALGAELHEQIGTEFHVDVDGDVVGEHRQRGRGG